MSISNRIHILKNKMLALGYLGLSAAFLSMSGVTSAVPITMEEKELVIQEIQACLENDVVFMSIMPKYQDIPFIGKRFGKKWEDAKAKSGANLTMLGNKNNEMEWNRLVDTDDRAEFKSEMNKILRAMFSHLRLEDARPALEKEFKEVNKQLKIGYTANSAISPCPVYKINTVFTGGKGAEMGLQPGNGFVLSTPGTIPFKYTTDADKTETKQGVRFYCDGKVLDKTFAFTYNNEKNNPISHYLLDAPYLKGLRQECLCMGAPYFYTIKVGSFSQGAYPGGQVESAMQFVTDEKVQNLVIDLRGNAGGAVSNLNHLLSFFIAPEQPYGISVTREAFGDALENDPACRDIVGNAAQLDTIVDDQLFFECVASFIREQKKYANLIRFVPLDEVTKNRQLFTGYVVILIDENIASAAENFTQVMRELLKDRCKVIGKKSSGRVLTISSSCYAGTFKIVYPYKDYLSIGGSRIEGMGLEPDAVLDMKSLEEQQKELAAAGLEVDVLEGYLRAHFEERPH